MRSFCGSTSSAYRPSAGGNTAHKRYATTAGAAQTASSKTPCGSANTWPTTHLRLGLTARPNDPTTAGPRPTRPSQTQPATTHAKPQVKPGETWAVARSAQADPPGVGGWVGSTPTLGVDPPGPPQPRTSTTVELKTHERGWNTWQREHRASAADDQPGKPDHGSNGK